MAISALSGIDGLSALSALAPAGAQGSGGWSAPVKTAAPTGSISFGEALSKVQSSIDQADELARQLATGELTDIHQYTVAASKAQLGVQLTVALRNQMIGAFQEVMRMQL